jgi:hypothetical protein
MNIGYLTPKGELIECESYGHMGLALDLVEEMADAPVKSKTSGIEAEKYLQELGYIVVRARDCYGLIGYRKKSNSEQRLHMTNEQRTWLLEHYEEFNPEKREYVDKLFDWDR